MQEQFERFCENIKLTTPQRDDAKTKYSGVCKKIHEHFYAHEYNGDTKLLFGSYSPSKNTAIRPMSPDQDVDVLFKIPEDIFQQYYGHRSGGQSALLQKIRDILLESRYALGEKPKAWGKVILVKTADGTHNVELLPAYEQKDGSFIIPNSEDGGNWDVFNPREELVLFRKSNEQTEGLTADLSRMMKRWSREVSSVSIKSFEIENFVIDFLARYNFDEKSYSEIVRDFFSYLYGIVDEDNKSYVKTAKDRSDKALGLEKEGMLNEATTEWKKVFGDSSFPAAQDRKESSFEEFILSLERKYPSPDEEHLVRKYGIDFEINPEYEVTVDVSIDQSGWRSKHWILSQFQKMNYRIHKKAKLNFFISSNNIPHPYEVKWKVRNFGDEAQGIGKLRGEITDDNGAETKEESTLYHGEHYVQCYVVKGGRCVAVGSAFVPVQ